MLEMIKKFSTVLVFCLTIGGISSGCPKTDAFKPCECQESVVDKKPIIRCGGSHDIDLIKVFENLSQSLRESDKHFKYFYLYNTAVTEIRDNTFKDISFERIAIIGCTSLTRIQPNAFAGTDAVTETIEIKNNLVLHSPDNSFYRMLSKFIAANTISLRDSDIDGIPPNAFNPPSGHQDKLKILVLSGSSINKLPPYTFSKFPGLESITLIQTSIETIPDNAFAFELPSNKSLDIELNFNFQWNQTSFSSNSFRNIRRPTRLAFNSLDTFDYVNEHVFRPFFSDNQNNHLDLVHQQIDCNSCLNSWLKSYANRIIGRKSVCSNGNQLNDPDNFSNCSKYT